jgi:hypothetical protein
MFNGFRFIERDAFCGNPLPKKVVEGDSGWIFLGDEYDDDIRESKGLRVFSDADLEIIARKVIINRDWLAAHNIAYYLAIAPNKLSVYGSMLGIQENVRPKKYEQLTARLRNNGVHIVDLGALFRAHPERFLYYKTDSHWNDFGAYLGYTILVDSLRVNFPSVHRDTISAYRIELQFCKTGELTKMLRITQPELRTVLKRITIGQSREQAVSVDAPTTYRGNEAYAERYLGPSGAPKIVAFKDSFMRAMVPFIKESFCESLFIHTTVIDTALVLRERPTIVVQEIVARNIDNLKY